MNICLNCLRENPDAGHCPHCGAEVGHVQNSFPCLPAATILAGRYLLGRVLGQGGFGITYLAHQFSLGMRVAIKEYFPGDAATRHHEDWRVSSRAAGDQGYGLGLEMFIAEARRIVQFHHPNIVRAIDFLQANGTAYLVMEYVEGISLDRHLQLHGGRLGEDRALEIMRPVLDGVREIHRLGMVHRDIKPDNIYLTETGQVMLLDFGSARPVGVGGSRSMTLMISPSFSAPELYSRRGEQGCWSDVYSCAATLYYCLSGQRPADALERCDPGGPLNLAPLGSLARVSPPVEKAIMRGLALRREERWQSVEEFVQALQKKGGPDKKKKEFVVGSRELWLILGFLLLALTSVAGYLTYDHLRREQEKKLSEVVIGDHGEEDGGKGMNQPTPTPATTAPPPPKGGWQAPAALTPTPEATPIPTAQPTPEATPIPTLQPTPEATPIPTPQPRWVNPLFPTPQPRWVNPLFPTPQPRWVNPLFPTPQPKREAPRLFPTPLRKREAPRLFPTPLRKREATPIPTPVPTLTVIPVLTPIPRVIPRLIPTPEIQVAMAPLLMIHSIKITPRRVAPGGSARVLAMVTAADQSNPFATPWISLALVRKGKTRCQTEKFYLQSVGGHEAAQTLSLPPDIPPGKYELICTLGLGLTSVRKTASLVVTETLAAPVPTPERVWEPPGGGREQVREAERQAERERRRALQVRLPGIDNKRNNFFQKGEELLREAKEAYRQGNPGQAVEAYQGAGEAFGQAARDLLRRKASGQSGFQIQQSDN